MIGFTACSETKNIAENETLYTGIRKIKYEDKGSGPHYDEMMIELDAALSRLFHQAQDLAHGTVLKVNIFALHKVNRYNAVLAQALEYVFWINFADFHSTSYCLTFMK